MRPRRSFGTISLTTSTLTIARFIRNGRFIGCLTSGKKNGFKALIYMHRYREDTIARIRTDYVHEQQGRYRTAIADLESRIANADTGSRVKLTKQLTKLQNQAEELRVYEEKNPSSCRPDDPDRLG